MHVYVHVRCGIHQKLSTLFVEIGFLNGPPQAPSRLGCLPSKRVPEISLIPQHLDSKCVILPRPAWSMWVLSMELGS